MGKYPFMTVANQYLSANAGVLAPTTQIEIGRRLKRMNKDFGQLVASGKIKQYNPMRMTEKEVIAYIGLLRARKMKDSGVDHNLTALGNILRFVGNGALDKAKMRYPQHFHKNGSKRLKPLDEEQRGKIIKAANMVQDNDWRKMEAYGLVVTAICTGLRPKELRFAKITDLDLEKGTLHAEEVKGKDSYGEPRNTAIHPDGIPFLKRYVNVRATMIMKRAPDNQVLFPARSKVRSDDGVFSLNGLTDLRGIVKRETGVNFDLRMCRRTFGQVGIDNGVSTESVSRMMGHSSTKTTEKYYCRKTQESAIQEAQQVWGNSPKPQSMARPMEPKTPLIKKFEWIAGYN
jgi:integrase/recombinase XerD